MFQQTASRESPLSVSSGQPLATAFQRQGSALGRGYTCLLVHPHEVCVELSPSHLGSVLVLAVQGRLDHTHAKEFASALAPYLAGCTLDGSPIVLDFSHVAYISSVGLRELLLASKQVKEQQGKIAIAALTPIVGEVFQVSHFNLVLKVFPDVAAAAAALGTG